MFQITGIGATEECRKRQVDFGGRTLRLLLAFQAVTSFGTREPRGLIRVHVRQEQKLDYAPIGK